VTTPARRSAHLLNNPELFDDQQPLSVPGHQAGVPDYVAARIRRRQRDERAGLTVDVEIRMRDTIEDASRFRNLTYQMRAVTMKRLPEAVLERSLRRLAVAHGSLILRACAVHRFRGRTVCEEDLIEALEVAFRLRAPSPLDARFAHPDEPRELPRAAPFFTPPPADPAADAAPEPTEP
jgi:hypothetical protein